MFSMLLPLFIILYPTFILTFITISNVFSLIVKNPYLFLISFSKNSKGFYYQSIQLCVNHSSVFLFKLGVSFVVLNYISLSFMQIHTVFYFNYIIYSGLLIFCCQNVATFLLYQSFQN